MFAIRFTALALFLLSVFVPWPGPDPRDPCAGGFGGGASDIPCWGD